MPDPEGPAVVQARRQKMEAQSARSGRASTNLTGNAAAAAAPTFSNQTLGS
jgi:hypothetical protein